MSGTDLLAHAALLEVLDYLPDGVVFVKDAQARYLYGNDTLLRRLGITAMSELLGRTSSDVFPAPLGASYTRQDLLVLGGQELTEHLELHLYPTAQVGWCLTTKRALREPCGGVRGVVGLSRDLSVPQEHLPELGEVMAYLQAHFAERLTISALAARAGMSLSTFERQVRRVYGVTPTQLLTRIRIGEATRLLRQTDWPITRVALECGYFDHSAFTRVFRATVGLTPRAFRQLKEP